MSGYLSPAPPRVFAHRGLALNAVENTELAFAAARDAGAVYLETDVHLSRDGVVVLWHDPDLRRFDGSRDRLSRLSWAELSNRRSGEATLLRLDEALRRFPNERFNIDIKIAAALQPTLEVIRQHDAAHRVLIASFHDRRRRRAAAELPGVATSLGQAAVLGCVIALVLPKRARLAVWRRVSRGAVALQVPTRAYGVRIIRPRLVETAQLAGLEVHAWTINEPDQMRELVTMGISGIVTDRVDLAVDTLELSTG